MSHMEHSNIQLKNNKYASLVPSLQRRENRCASRPPQILTIPQAKLVAIDN